MNPSNTFRVLPAASFVLGLAAMFGSAACSAGTVVAAHNPLTTTAGEATLEAHRAPKSLPVESSPGVQACAAPVEDVVDVVVSKAEVCIETVRIVRAPAGSTIDAIASETDAVSLTSERGTRLFALPATAQPKEVTTCSAAGGAPVAVYRVVHRACALNDGLVSPSTHELVFDRGSSDEIRWEFAGDHRAHGRDRV